MSRVDLLRSVLLQFFKDASKASALTISEEDKLYESSRTDSGFLSSGNLQSSEIISEEIKVGPHHHLQDRYHQDQDHQQDSGVIDDDPKGLMRLDSGIDTCLSQLSGLSLKNSGLNDLGKCKEVATSQTPWEKYYEQDEDGDTHLHIAILQGYLEGVFALIRSAPHPRLLDTPNDDAQSPLHLAVATGQWRLARWLVVAGARPSPRNRAGDSPLHIAARSGDILSCKAITDAVQQQERDMLGLSYPAAQYHHCELDQWNYDGQTPVHVAALQGHVDVLRHLVWYGADVNAREGTSGYTALHIAIERGDEKLVHFLLDECKKLNVESVTYGGRSALQLGPPVAETLLDVLIDRGVPYSPFVSEDDDTEDSDDELMYEESANIIKPSMYINASA